MSSRNGGTSTSSAGRVVNASRRFSMVMPAMMSIAPAMSRIGSDSATIRRSSGSPDRTTPTTLTRARPAVTAPSSGDTNRIPTQ